MRAIKAGRVPVEALFASIVPQAAPGRPRQAHRSCRDFRHRRKRSRATLIDNHDGIWSYTPKVDDDGSVAFSYQVSDGAAAAAASAKLDITRAPDETVLPTTSGDDQVSAGSGNVRADGGLG